MISAGVYLSARSNVLSPFLRDMLREIPANRANTQIAVYVKVEGDGRTAARNCNCTYRYGAGKWHVFECAVSDILNCLAGLPSVEWVDVDIPAKYMPLLDKSAYHAKFGAVQEPVYPLVVPVKGDSVVIGIIDTGIDPYHPAFRDSSGKSRVLFIWDHRTSCGNAPAPYGYGCEWDGDQINAGVASHRDYYEFWAHGTGVASVAAGSDYIYDKYWGVAPNAYIIAVAVDFWSPGYTSRFTDAFHYIFSKADSLGLPCVINVSLGGYWGSHDGKDPASQLVAALIREKAGRVVVAAAGNGTLPSQPYHVLIDLGADDSAFVWLVYSPWDLYFRPDSTMVIDFWGDPPDMDSFMIAFGLDSVSIGTPSAWHKELVRTSWIPSSVIGYGTPYTHLLLLDSIPALEITCTRYLMYDSAVTWLRITFRLMESIFSIRDKLFFRIMFKGPVKTHAWSNPYTTGTSTIVYPAIMPSPPDTPPWLHKVVVPDNYYTIASGIQCLDEVISVGNFVNRNDWIDYRGVSHRNYTLPEGELWIRSSWGPTRDNRLKPDLTAPGQVTISAFPAIYRDQLLSSQPGLLVWTGMHRVGTGTSISAPVVTGAVALSLSLDPSLSWLEVKRLLWLTSTSDSFTGSTPNFKWGYGKLSVWNLIMVVSDKGCTDRRALNYDSGAQWDNGTCIYTPLQALPLTSTFTNPGVYNVWSLTGQRLSTGILSLPSGVYIQQINTGNRSYTRKAIEFQE